MCFPIVTFNLFLPLTYFVLRGEFHWKHNPALLKFDDKVTIFQRIKSKFFQ